MFGMFEPPQDGKPQYENWVIALGSAWLLYYFAYLNKPSKEISYQDFVQQLQQGNKVKRVDLLEEKNNPAYKYRAVIHTHDDEQFYMVLPQVENFLMKLDMV